MNTTNPREVDEALAALWHKRSAAEISLGYNHSHVHTLIRERFEYATKTRKRWPTTDAVAVEKLIAALAALDAHYAETGTWSGAPGPVATYDMDSARRTLASIDKNRAEIATLDAQIAELEEIYRCHRWSRFFVVTSSAGHVHRSTFCHTCRPTTEYGWLPDLSGKSEDDAVAKLGPALCSVCFPSAPVEFQENKITKAQAAKLAA